MARWISDERIAELERAGKLNDNVKRIGRPTPEEKARMAGEWNGNIEPVEITSGGVESRHAATGMPAVGPDDQRAGASKDRHLVSERKIQPIAGVATGPLTLQCRDDVKNQRRPSTAPSAAPLYPLVGL